MIRDAFWVILFFVVGIITGVGMFIAVNNF